MSRDPREVASRFYEIMNEGALERVDSICSKTLRGHGGAGADLKQLKASLGSFIEAFPDLWVDVRHLVCEGDMVSAWLTYSGTHQGDFAGVPGSGRKVRFAAWDLIRVENGQIVEITMFCDLFTLMNQIGALATSAPA